MRRTWTAAAAAAALATAFATPVALAQETQQGKEAPGAAGSVQHRQTGQGQMGGQATKPGAQAQTERPQTSAGEREQPSMGAGEREQPGKPGMKGQSAQTQQPENRLQPQEERGAQGQERRGQAESGNRPGQPGTGTEQNRTGQAQLGQAQNRQTETGGQMGQAPNRQGQVGGQKAGRNVQATGKTNIPHEKAAQVAQTLMLSGSAQTSPHITINEVRIGADMPGDVVINPLPPAIVEIVPEFRGYDYFLIGDEVVIVDPASRQVVEIIEGVG